MKIDGGIGFDPSGVAEQAAKAEASGYDGVWSAETSHDPFLPIAIGAGATTTLEFGTGITVAFARNPMTLAVLANDLQLLTKGRFMMGMGSQIKPHITKRFSMPWSHPAPRMREMILAIRAIWKTWETGEKLDFRGEFYTHTLMTPFFDPGPNPHGNPKILLAGGRRADDRGGGRGRRRLLGPRLHDRALPAREEPARAGTGRGQGGQDPGRPDGVVPGLRGHRRERQGDRGGQPGGAPADRVLRLDAGLPPGARVARLGRPAARAQHALQAGRVGEDGRDHRRRDAQRLRRGGPARPGGVRGPQPLRRRGRPLQLLRALQGRRRGVLRRCWRASRTEALRPRR